ncbi:MAG: SdpI family protein [Steroidobacteraceae bacterium]
MRNPGRFWLAMMLVAASFAAAAALYGRLPATIPTHWNAQGVIDGWMPKSQGVFIGPGMALVISLFLILIEPAQTEEDPDGLKARYYPTIVAAVSGICFYCTIGVLMAGMGWHVDMPSHVAIGLGLLIVVLGNSLGKVPQNGVVGVRTPWTLADKEVWRRTHRVAGWLVVLAGVFTAITGLVGLRVVPGLIAIGAAAVVSVAYSYVVWRRLNRGNGGRA